MEVSATTTASPASHRAGTRTTSASGRAPRPGAGGACPRSTRSSASRRATASARASRGCPGRRDPRRGCRRTRRAPVRARGSASPSTCRHRPCRSRSRSCAWPATPSAFDAADDQAPRVERQRVAVEVAPRARDVEVRGREHRDQLVRRVDAKRVADRLPAAVAADERPVGETATAFEVEVAALDHERAGVELLPVHLLEAAGEREQVDRVDEERGTAAERACDGGDDTLVLGLFVEVPDHAREEVDRGIELGVEVELARVALDERRVKAFARRCFAGERDRAWAEVDSGDVETAAGELEAVPSVTAGDVEHACVRLELEPLEHEVDLLARPLGGNVQRDLVEPLLLEVAVEPVARDVAQAVRTARSSTMPASTDVSASTLSSAFRARSAASSARRRAPSTPSVTTKPSPSRMSSTTWKSIPSSFANARQGRCAAAGTAAAARASVTDA